MRFHSFLFDLQPVGPPRIAWFETNDGDNKGGFRAVTELPPRGSAILESASEVRPRHLENIYLLTR